MVGRADRGAGPARGPLGANRERGRRPGRRRSPRPRRVARPGLPCPPVAPGAAGASGGAGEASGEGWPGLHRRMRAPESSGPRPPQGAALGPFCSALTPAATRSRGPAAGRGRQLAPLDGAGLEPADHQGEAGVAFCSKPRRTCTPRASAHERSRFERSPPEARKPATIGPIAPGDMSAQTVSAHLRGRACACDDPEAPPQRKKRAHLFCCTLLITVGNQRSWRKVPWYPQRA